MARIEKFQVSPDPPPFVMLCHLFCPSRYWLSTITLKSYNLTFVNLKARQEHLSWQALNPHLLYAEDKNMNNYTKENLLCALAAAGRKVK